MPKNETGKPAEKTINSKYVFKGHAFSLRIDTVITADGRRAIREIVEHPGVVVVVPIDGEDNVLMVDQFRTPAGKHLLEIPAGGIETGEAVAAAVMREMQEETGYKPRKLVYLGGFYSSPGISTEYMHLYLATDLVPSRLEAEDTAEIELVRVPVAQVLEMVMSGRIEDSKSLAGLLLMLEWRKKHAKE